jgi:uncharacterized membrane protein YgcG
VIPETIWWIAILAVVAVLVIGTWRQMRAKPDKKTKRKRSRDGGGYAEPVPGGAGGADGMTKKSSGDGGSWDGGGEGGGGDGGGGGGD